MKIISPALSRDLASDRDIINSHLHSLLLNQTMPDGGPVHEAMCYSVLGPGQRIRPLIGLRICRLLGGDSVHSTRAAGCVELLHCASLIVDDLPCMDNHDIRRNRPSVHAAYGEANAVLAAFGLVALAARSAVDFEMSCQEREHMQAFQIRLLQVLDVSGLISGQSLDLRLCGSQREQCRSRTAQLKTVPLFELAARAGVLFTGITAQIESCILDFGRRFGAAFQMTDDLVDGEVADSGAVLREIDNLRNCLRPFGRECRELQELVDYLHERAWQTNHRNR